MSIIEILKKYDIHPIKRFGQNFLVDPNIKRKIIESLPLNEEDDFIEIGPGLGAITEPLLKKGKFVTSIEIDKKLQAFLEQELIPKYPNFRLIKGDVLEVFEKNLLQSNDNIIIGNLPYYISSPILFRTLELSAFINKAYFTLQKEVVDRLVAKPGSKNYGRLSAGFGYFTAIKKLFDITPGCFTPKPDVCSSFIEIEFKKKFKADFQKKEDYLHLVKVAFSERRKQLINLLSKNYGLKQARGEDLMIRLGLPPKARAEELSPNNFWKLLEYIDKFQKKI